MTPVQGAVTVNTRQELSEKLAAIAHAFALAGDEVNRRKMNDLLQKLQNNTFVLAFCGHFSAGKSSMINALIGEQLLPTSPIPTSANVVTIRSGESFARAYLLSGDMIEFDSAEHLDEIKNYCINGDTVEAVEISHPTEKLPSGVQVMDTPGIDSTDDAHKIATESALHLADVILYVMDYNHVQSEVNFEFTKTLKERNKPVYLVINQIDKHNDWELTFEEFKQSVQEGFSTWQIEPDGMYFTTLAEPFHPENQLRELSQRIQQLFAVKDQLILHSVLHTAAYLIEEHGKWKAKENDEERQMYQTVLAEAENVQETLDRFAVLQSEMKALEQKPGQLEHELKQELFSLIDHAILTPFSTTERARLYLQSRKPGFKVGFFFAANKTKAEKESRLQALYEELRERVSSQLDWHMKELLARIPERFGPVPEEYLQKVYAIDLSFGPDLIERSVKEGALSHVEEYVYNFTKELAGEIRSMYRRTASAFIEEAVAYCQQAVQREIASLREESQELTRVIEAKTRLQEIAEAEQRYVAALQNQLQIDWELDPERMLVCQPEGGVETDSVLFAEPTFPLQRKESAAIVSKIVDVPKTPSSEDGGNLFAEKEPEQPGESTGNETYKEQLRHTANMLRNASKVISDVIGMQSAAKAMVQRAERLENNLFTVALFGAFSAGKSSFANALMGNRVLPVSPNPTTAAINKILPPTEKYPHGTVRVKIKSLDEMMADVCHSLSYFERQAQDFDEAVAHIETLEGTAIHPNAKPHYTFLKAVARGIEEMRPHLGGEQLVDLNAFQEFVAREEKACFAEWIELYYDCPLTAQGIALVDTPGADSINARHTGVAFEYIKNADAVLFVTYYNHAFSFADREFLIQLGRVKDTFEMDKMFFIVNAADLAHSEEELSGVVAHVRKNLVSCGISMPRIYPVSSQTALLARMHGKGLLSDGEEKLYRQRMGIGSDSPLPDTKSGLERSGLATFEKDFFTFTIEELTAIAVKAAYAEVKQSLAALDELIAMANEAESARTAKLAEIARGRQSIEQGIREIETASEERSIEKEISELMYYVKQRIFLRFPDLFKTSFNPAVLKDDGRDIKKTLSQCLDELLRFIGYDLAQEMRATALRVEKAAGKSVQRIHDKITDVVKGVWPACMLQAPMPFTRETPEFSEQLPGDRGTFAPSLSFYKNAKDFFENNMKEKMKEDLEKRLQEPVTAYLQAAEERLKAVYLESFRQAAQEDKSIVHAEIEEYAKGLEAALSLQMDVRELEEKRLSLMALMADS
ncbi:GTPase [Collibacillus ludicampi]|uniref:GTPase n=1 Tax=Collibacillus ludicampi TaxID=2771369 RepID=A0AAV4LF37_9BACL|nr:dynamin family protein [Collibacillus ludicampi]GIM46439.1 GTPase [Collibacillus ludicampi]